MTTIGNSRQIHIVPSFLIIYQLFFTHADLHPSNILLSPGSDPHIIAIIDWQQSGWYPEYWEYCKALWTSPIGEEWESKYLPLFLKRYESYDF
jgi:predicted unusual protein kinase regulating ubiquinone biosynthesis (AarF/ABC1/UbiB family)